MIDFHNHIIPNLDDGSKSINMTIEMMQLAASQGITDVVNTVHYQHPKITNKKISYDFVKLKINKLNKIMSDNDINIKLHIGAEVFYRPNLTKIKKDPLTTFENGKYMLIEFQYHQFPNEYLDELFNLKISGCTPIIAHPERYLPVQKNPELLRKMLEIGCIIQINAGSPLGFFGKHSKKASLKILKNNWCQIIGSDAHNNRNRNFCLLECMKYLKRKVDFDISQLINKNPRKVIYGEPISTNNVYNKQNSSRKFYFNLEKFKLLFK